jgi:hypothetical protein
MRESSTLLSVGAAPVPHAAPGRILRRKCDCGKNTSGGGDCGACERKTRRLQRRAADARPESTSVPDSVHEVLRSAGSPLDTPTRSFFESRLGHDFSGVRVHTDSRAAESAAAVGSLAYTVGSDIAFGANQYAPGTSAGRRLLAHELTHVLQQRGRPSAMQGKLAVGPAEDDAEREADRVAEHVLSPATGGPVKLTAARASSLQRKAGGCKGG